MKRHILAWIVLATVAFGLPQKSFLMQWKAASGAFSPLDIANCELWLDVSDSSTVTLDGSAITAIADKSSIGDNAVQIGADSTRPTIDSASQNGLDTASFDGGDYLGVNYKSVNGQMVFLVAKSTNTGVYIIGSRDSYNQRSFIWDGGLSSIRVGVGDSGCISATTAWGSVYHIVGFDYDSSDVHIYVDAALEDTTAQSGSGANTVSGYYIGTFNNAGTPFPTMMRGNIAEVIIYKRVLTTSERQQVEAYLSTKWAL